MENSYCLIPFVFLLPIIMITLGLVYIFKKDMAWRITAKMISAVRPQRTPEWERYATINGLILLVSGLVIAVFLISKLLQ